MKKVIALFFILIIILPHLAFAEVGEKIWGGIKWFGGEIWEVIKWAGGKIWDGVEWSRGIISGDYIAKGVSKAIVFVIETILKMVHFIFSLFNEKLLPGLIGVVSVLDPFYQPNANVKSPAETMWKILRTFAYLIIIFSALGAAYEWIFGEEAQASRFIFNIIIVAFIMNFTFLLVREAFYIALAFEISITGGENQKIGFLISNSLWSSDPFEELSKAIEKIAESESDETIRSIIQALASVAAFMLIIVFDMIVFAILISFLVLYTFRYLFITILAATSSLAIATLALPQLGKIKSLGSIMGTLRIWNSWLDYLVRWLVVIPILITLVLLGHTLKDNIINQLSAIVKESNSNSPSNQSGKNNALPQLFQFLLILLIIGGWYIFSLNAALAISGSAGEFIKNTVLGTLLATTTGALLGGIRSLYNKGRITIGGGLRKVGTTIGQKTAIAPRYSPIRIFSPFATWAVKKGKQMETQPITATDQARATITGTAAQTAIQRLGRVPPSTQPATAIASATTLRNLAQRSKTDEEIKSIANTIKGMNQADFVNFATNPEAMKILTSPELLERPEILEAVRGKILNLDTETLKIITTDSNLFDAYLKFDERIVQALAERIDKMSTEDFGSLITNVSAFRNITKTNLPQTILNKINKKIMDLNDETFSQILGDRGLLGVLNQADQKIKQNIAERLATLKDKNVIEGLSKLGNELEKSLSELSQSSPEIIASLNQATSGLIDALRSKNPEQIGTIILSLSHDVYKNLDKLVAVSRSLGAETEMTKGLLTALKLNFEGISQNVIKNNQAVESFRQIVSNYSQTNKKEFDDIVISYYDFLDQSQRRRLQMLFPTDISDLLNI